MRLRLSSVPRPTALEPRRRFAVSPARVRDTPATARDFSAASYHVARELRRSADVPSGAIHSSWGGTRIAGRMPDAALTGTGLGDAVRLRALTARDPTLGQAAFGAIWEAWRTATSPEQWAANAAGVA